MAEETGEQKSPSLWELALLFLKLGTIGFGGPAAHIAMMEEEIVRRRRWMTRDDFLDLLGATNLIPGPNSTEMAIHIGHRQGGWLGLIVAGVSFILPAVIIVLVFAWIYVRYGSLPQVAGVLYGVKPVIIAIVLQALWSLGRTAIKNVFLAVVGLAGVVLAFLGIHELLILLGGGVIVGLSQLVLTPFRSGKRSVVFASPMLFFLQSTAATTTTFGLLPLFLAVVGLAGVVLAFLGIHELLILLGSGVIVGLSQLVLTPFRSGKPSVVFAAPMLFFLQSTAATTTTFGLLPLFLFFLKVGAVLYGSGYVLLAFLRADLVERWQWLTESQLLDAIAVGQVTPGPVFTTATFIGYVLGGLSGATVATAGIFLPAFLFVAASGPLVPRIRRSPAAGAFLDGINAASLALMFVVTYQLGRAAVIDVPTIVLALLSAVALFRFHLNSAWLILGGALLGLLMSAMR